MYVLIKYKLDTNHCSYAILGHAQLLDRLNSCSDDVLVSTCTIVKGELFDMAARSKQGTTQESSDCPVGGWRK